ncbi:helix-turn-helix domain-containing protein [Lactobacillus sp. PV034]|uniref:helix-turn-helix domain-containing protein n=1 Tax=Lactobacillus sp. PV034 TaxID=2594495 RepID=UPI0022405B0D|nr:helix-turn-helix transcriptional regulator [Lactobacillus sp. PV034]QNQ80815.1 helix-turn-helix transcriptional regulator [Lactobacillus sp. PV034]
MNTFDRIKKLAKKNGMSLQIVAEKSGIGINTIYKWKNYDPKGTDLAKVAKQLHTTTDYLLCNTDDPKIPDSTTNDGLSWSDLGMPYGGSIPDDLKGYYKVMAEQYVKEHPDLFKGDE